MSRLNLLLLLLLLLLLESSTTAETAAATTTVTALLSSESPSSLSSPRHLLLSPHLASPTSETDDEAPPEALPEKITSVTAAKTQPTILPTTNSTENSTTTKISETLTASSTTTVDSTAPTSITSASTEEAAPSIILPALASITSTENSSYPASTITTPKTNLQTSTVTTSASTLTSTPSTNALVKNEIDEILSPIPVITYLLQERQSLVDGLASLAEKMDNMTLVLTSHLHTRDTREAEVTERNTMNRPLVDRPNQFNTVNLSLSAQKNHQLLLENYQLRRDKAKAEEENRELAQRLIQTMRNTENASRVLEEIKTKSKLERNHTRSRTETLMKETEEQREINRKTREEKRRLEERLAEMENLIYVMERNKSKLEEENGEKDQQIRDTEEEKSQIEEKNRLMAEELEGCKFDVSNLARRPAAPRDCAEVYCSGVRRDGVFTIAPFSSRRLVTAWCDMTSAGGGWTVFLKRQQAGHHENFVRDWVDYRRGFGRVWGEYWLGLETLHRLTSPRYHSDYHLRLSATNMDEEQRDAIWKSFSVASERTGYQLRVSSYDPESSTLGDSLIAHHDISGRNFSTRDRDNDALEGGDCVAEFSMGGGWWYRRCAFISPTGPHIGSGKHMLSLWSPGNLTWVSTKLLSMMVRPATFPAC